MHRQCQGISLRIKALGGRDHLVVSTALYTYNHVIDTDVCKLQIRFITAIRPSQMLHLLSIAFGVTKYGL